MYTKILGRAAGVLLLTALTVTHANGTSAGDPIAGQAKAAMCLGCHGADGNSLVPTFPKLAGLGHKYLLKQLVMLQIERISISFNVMLRGQVGRTENFQSNRF